MVRACRRLFMLRLSDNTIEGTLLDFFRTLTDKYTSLASDGRR